jgi:hypothetical protein
MRHRACLGLGLLLACQHVGLLYWNTIASRDAKKLLALITMLTKLMLCAADFRLQVL